MADHHSSPPDQEDQLAKAYKLSAVSISYAKPLPATTSTSLRRLLFHHQPPPLSTPSSPSSPAPSLLDLQSSYILRNVSFTALPGELLAVVGPSGAGKSTLLDILSTRITPTSGSLYLNSSPLQPSSFRRLSSHLPQHDSSLPHLTVSETFFFAARLLSAPPSAVASLLSELRLSHLSHERLPGSLSGGERRRVSVGLSLLSDPRILLLDEPTSGLDSASALSLLRTLRRLATSRHVTIILTIHQPSSSMLSTLHSLLLLSKGFVLHHGAPNSLHSYLHSLGFHPPSQLNPLEFAMEVLDHLPHSTTPPSKPTFPSSSSQTTHHHHHDIHYATSRLNEIITLYSRSWKITYRTKQLLLTNTLQPLGVGFLLGTIYTKAGYDKQGIDKRLGLFAYTLTFLLASTSETLLPIFVKERPILLREASAGVYRLSSHLLATTLVFVPYLLGVAFLYSMAVYFLVGLCMANWGAFAWFVLVVWAVVLAANSLVLFISSLAPDYIAGTSLLAVALAGFFLFSGYFISKGSVPVYWLFMHYLSPYKHGLDALLANEYGCAATRCFGWEGGECALTGRDVMERRGLKVEQRWEGLQALLGFFVMYRVLYWVVLTRRASKSKK